MKKLLVSILSACLLISSLSASEWGGILRNNSKGATQDFSSFRVNQADELYFWFRSNLGSKWTFSAESFYKYEFSYQEAGFYHNHTVDIDLFKLAFVQPLSRGKLLLNMGRFTIQDNTKITLNQLCDGLQFAYSSPVFISSLYAGYTGLLNSNTVTMLGPGSAPLSPENPFYSLSKGYIPVSLTFTFPVVFANQYISAQAFAVIDPTEEAFSRYYANLLLKGYLTNIFYYSIISQFATVNFQNVMNYSQADLTLIASKKFNAVIGCSYASGNNAIFSPYNGVSSSTSYTSLVSNEYTSTLIPNLAFVLMSRKTKTILNTKAIFDCDDNFNFKGLDMDLSFNWNVLSDLQMGFNIHGYLDYITQGLENNYYATFRFAIAF